MVSMQIGKRLAGNGEHSRATDASIPTGGEVLPGGSLIELVRNPSDSSHLQLLLSKNGKIKAASSLEDSGQTYVPRVLPAKLSEALRLPTRPESYGSTANLFQGIADVFQDFSYSCGFGVIPYLILSTWFLDCLPVAPCLLVTGPAQKANEFFQLLSCFCSHSLCLADLRPSSFGTIPMDLRPTLLIFQPQLSRHTESLLRASNYRGYFIAGPGGVHDVYGARVIYLGEHGKLQLPAGLHVELIPADRSSPDLSREALDKIAAKFQNRLLGYRLANHAKISTADFNAPKFSNNIGTLARSLGMCIVGDPKLQAEVIPLLRGLDEQERAERANGLLALTIEAALFFDHEGKKQKLFVGKDLTPVVNHLRRARGETLLFNAEEVGYALKRLQLFTCRLSNAGKGLVLDRPVRIRIHELAYAYDVPSVSDGVRRCELCRDQQPAETKAVVKGVHGVNTFSKKGA